MLGPSFWFLSLMGLTKFRHDTLNDP